ncbi:MAG: hypothetical protein WC628_02755 [Candidatus Omnitrophota bacterium]
MWPIGQKSRLTTIYTLAFTLCLIFPAYASSKPVKQNISIERAFAASFKVLSCSRSVVIGSSAFVRVRVTNTGTKLWPKDKFKLVACAYLPGNTQIADLAIKGNTLTANLAPQESTVFVLEIPTGENTQLNKGLEYKIGLDMYSPWTGNFTDEKAVNFEVLSLYYAYFRVISCDKQVSLEEPFHLKVAVVNGGARVISKETYKLTLSAVNLDDNTQISNLTALNSQLPDTLPSKEYCTLNLEIPTGSAAQLNKAGIYRLTLNVADLNSNYITEGKKLLFEIKDAEQLSITSISPADNSTFLAGAKINIQANVFNPGNLALQYQFLIGGLVVRAWSSSSTYSWQTSTSDTGVVNIACEVKDAKGTQTLKTITYRVINPTVEEILQKIVDNYALVNDKKMDVIMISNFNNEPFGSATYTRHYFKKPDKQKTETFENSQRADSTKTEIHIVNGLDTYLIDPKTRARLNGNILNDAKTTQEQLNQMDEVYHLQDFLNAHFVTRINDNPDDLTKGIVMLDVVPKIPHNFYRKLLIQIDYLKGLKTKTFTYFEENNQVKLKQTLETTDSIMLNNVWIPAKQVKTLYLTDGNLVMNYNFENIQVNTNLADELFDPEKQ